MTVVQFRILGPVQIRCGPAELDLGGRQQRLVLALLHLLRFRSLVTRARQSGDPARSVRLFTEGLALWQGRCATGLEPVAASQPAFVALESERSHAARDAADQALRAGLARAVVPALRQAASLDPLDEPLQARLLLALAADGRQAEAFDLFRTLRRRLVEELGIDPGPELLDAHDRLLHQRLPLAGPVHAPVTGRRLRRKFSRPRNRIN